MRKSAPAIALLFCSLAAGQQTIRIGQAVVALTGPWKFHVGDNPKWADPNFDDSSWENVDLTPKGATDYAGPTSEFVPGWTAMGHPGYAGYAWYRLRVPVEQTSGPLSLLMPLEVDDGYQVFANGRQIGRFGDITRRRPVCYFSTAEWFPLPTEAAETTTLAIRFYMYPSTLSQPDSGGMHGPPRLGAAGVIAAFGMLARQQPLIAYASDVFEFVVYIGFAFALLALYWLDRIETVYLWFACAYLALALTVGVEFVRAAIPDCRLEIQHAAFVFGGCWVACVITAWWRWFGLNEKEWLIRLLWTAVLAKTLVRVCTYPPLLGTAVPVSGLGALDMLAAVAALAIVLLFAVLVVLGVRRQGREGWLALPAVLLFAVSYFVGNLPHLHIPTGWTIFGLSVFVGQIADVALSAVLGVLIISRFQRSQRRKQQLEADLRQAQQVQQVLLPQEIPALPGFRIDCEYRPAQEVGGDFFQVLETGRSLDRAQRAPDALRARDGSVLVVIGDVSGKGVKAAMLVALIIGTLRTIAEETEEPQMILQRLNRRLVGRMEGGFATCFCARIAQDGLMSVANAGHLAPFIDGEEIEVPHDLPLGIVEDIEYSERRLQLPENGTLTFISDGVVEAKNGRKELFGFERARALSAQSAAKIADAAKEFGQEDDITVVTIQRVAVAAYA